MYILYELLILFVTSFMRFPKMRGKTAVSLSVPDTSFSRMARLVVTPVIYTPGSLYRKRKRITSVHCYIVETKSSPGIMPSVNPDRACMHTSLDFLLLRDLVQGRQEVLAPAARLTPPCSAPRKYGTLMLACYVRN